MKKYCIENRAKKLFGLTDIFEFAGYILPDGSMLNFSYGGFQRDEDHRIIGQFFKKAQGTQALDKFMRRGNIRVMCNRDFYYFEYAKDITREQLLRLKEAEKDANKLNRQFLIEKDNSKGRVIKTYESVLEYLYDKGEI